MSISQINFNEAVDFADRVLRKLGIDRQVLGIRDFDFNNHVAAVYHELIRTPDDSHFLHLANQVQSVLDAPGMSWEQKYRAVFSGGLSDEIKTTGILLDYCDPDSSYEEDAQAYGRAVAQKAQELREAIK